MRTNRESDGCAGRGEHREGKLSFGQHHSLRMFDGSFVCTDVSSHNNEKGGRWGRGQRHDAMESTGTRSACRFNKPEVTCDVMKNDRTDVAMGHPVAIL